MTFTVAFLTQSSVLVLAVLGLHLTFGMLGLVNLTHGAMLLCGGYTGYFLLRATGSSLVSLVAAAVIVGAIGALLEVTIIRRLYDRPLESLVVTFGLTIFIRQLIILLFGPDPRGLPAPWSGSFQWAGTYVPRWDVALGLSAVVLTLVVNWTLMHTRVGLYARAAVANETLAETSAIPVKAVRFFVFTVGTGLAGLVGALIAPKYTLDSSFGLTLLVYSFFVIMLAGLGSIRGIWPASLIVGFVMVGFQYLVSPVSAQVLTFVAVLLLIRVREPVLVLASTLWRAMPTTGSRVRPESEAARAG